MGKVIGIDLGTTNSVVAVMEAGEAKVIPSEEGEPIWIHIDALDRQPLVADLPLVIPRALEAYHQQRTFTGLTTFRADGQPVLQFMP